VTAAQADHLAAGKTSHSGCDQVSGARAGKGEGTICVHSNQGCKPEDCSKICWCAVRVNGNEAVGQASSLSRTAMDQGSGQWVDLEKAGGSPNRRRIAGLPTVG